MERIEKQVYLRNIDKDLAEVLRKLKDVFNEKTSTKAVERLIKVYFPLVETLENEKSRVAELKGELAKERAEHHDLIVRTRAFYGNIDENLKIMEDFVKQNPIDQVP